MLQSLAFRRCERIVIFLSIALACSSRPRGGDQIRVGYGSLSTNYAPIWVAGEARLFQKPMRKFSTRKRARARGTDFR
jgi:hypothetical protein